MFRNKQIDDLLYNEDYKDKLVRDNYAAIYKYCFYHMRNKEDAEDITQEVFLKFFRSLDRYFEYGKIKNYLYVVAGNCIRDYFRKEKPFDMRIEETYDGGLDNIEDRLMVLEAIDSLDSIEKEIIILRYYQELKIKDIAEILDKPASTIRYKLKNAEKILKVKLGR